MSKQEVKSDWWHIVQRSRDEDNKRIEQGLRPRFKAEIFEPGGKITTTEQADKWIAAHCRKRDENGKHLPTSGRRRRARANKQ